MKLRIVSDLHIEYNKTDSSVIPVMENEDTQHLIIAGDLSHGYDWTGATEPYKFIEDMSKRFRTVNLVLGNHDYYGVRLQDFAKYLKNRLLPDFPNVNVLHNDLVILEDMDGKKLSIFGGTMWTDLYSHVLDEDAARNYHLTAKNGMMDYRHIKSQAGDNIEPLETVMEHNKFVETLSPLYPDVVISHHAPCNMSVSPQYEGHPLNACFVTSKDMTYLGSPKLWIHGHVHQSHNYKSFNGVDVIANPHGYGQENLEFNPFLVVDI